MRSDFFELGVVYQHVVLDQISAVPIPSQDCRISLLIIEHRDVNLCGIIGEFVAILKPVQLDRRGDKPILFLSRDRSGVGPGHDVLVGFFLPWPSHRGKTIRSIFLMPLRPEHNDLSFSHITTSYKREITMSLLYHICLKKSILAGVFLGDAV